MKKTMLIAFGGNAISSPKKRESVAARFKRLQKIVQQLKPLAKKYRLVVTHGNGLDIGNLLIQQEMAKRKVAPLSLNSLDAMTQGQLGYWLQQAFSNVFKKEVAVIVTRVLVDKKDSAFKRATKPIGPYIKGKRKLVPSPKPIKVLEGGIIKKLVEQKVIVVACGGGGIPVVQERGKLKGVEAVIDKDLCAVKLANLVGADFLLILTNIDGVYLNFGKKDQAKLKKLSIQKAKGYLKNGQFGVGSMKPKIEASIQFLEQGGKKCFIGSAQKPMETLLGKSGTELY